VSRGNLIKLAVLAVYSGTLFLLSAFHVIAQDEAQAWNIASASGTPWDILYHGEAEGHTPLWHFLLWLLKGFTVKIVPYFTSLLAILFAAILLRDEPFGLWICALFLFGYYTLYEYPSIPRPYILALVFSALFASALYRKQRNLIYLAVLLSIVAFSSAFGILLSVPLGVLALTMLWDDGWRPKFDFPLVTGLFLYLLAVSAAVYFVVFPLDTNDYAQVIVSGDRAANEKISEALVSAVFPHHRRLPLGIGEWFADTDFGVVVILAASFVVSVAVLALLVKRKQGVLAWIIAIVVISIGAKFSGTGITRHLGHLFIAAFCIVWATSGQARKTSFTQVRLPAVILVGVLCYHSVLGVAGVAYSVITPQTKGKEISEYIVENVSRPYRFITNNTHDIGHVMSYLDINVYDTVCDCWQRRADMSMSRAWEPTVMFEQWCRLYREENVQYALVSTEAPLPSDHRFQLMKEFGVGIRDNAGDRFQLWSMSSSGIDECGP